MENPKGAPCLIADDNKRRDNRKPYELRPICKYYIKCSPSKFESQTITHTENECINNLYSYMHIIF